MRIGAVLAVVVAAVALLAGCASPSANRSRTSATGASESVAATASNTVTRTRQHQAGEAIADIARGLVGTPYRYGGDHPREGFDCSGLVYFSHRRVNLDVPRTSRDQYQAARPVAMHQARPGDLVFFKDQSKLSHVGIYLGEQRFVHAPSSGKNVSVARLDSPYYRQHLIGVGRLY